MYESEGLISFKKEKCPLVLIGIRVVLTQIYNVKDDENSIEIKEKFSV